MDSLDVILYEVDRQWEAAWPGCAAETNVFAYAGLPEAYQPLPEPPPPGPSFRQ